MLDYHLGDFYDPQKKVEADELGYANATTFVKTTDQISFHIGQHEGKPANALECACCGGTDFKVGVAEYYTAIKCVTCLWEYNIHEG